MPRVAVAVLAVCVAAPAAAGGLDAWLARPEPDAGWHVASRAAAAGGEVVRLRGVSQAWRGIRWRHDLEVVVPARRRHPDVALLVVAATTGGRDAHRAIADAAGVTVAVLGDVPNQPLLGGRWEDDLVAETFARYVRTGDAEWPLLFPMTKAAVRAMDALQTFDPGLRRFVVTGASKRGWTAWLAGAVDGRVAGVVPVVFDNLRFEAQLPRQLAAWGRYSDRLVDYTGRGLPALLDTPRGRALVAEVDPWFRRDRLAAPSKLLVHGTNDPYWTVDATRAYWDGLAGEKAVLYVPNGGHGVAAAPRVRDATIAFLGRVAAGRALPVVAATVARDGPARALRVTVCEPAAAVRVWTATAPSADFRDARWTSTPATPAGDAFHAPLPAARGRFVAWFAEAAFDAGALPVATPIEVRRPDAAPAPVAGRPSNAQNPPVREAER